MHDQQDQTVAYQLRTYALAGVPIELNPETSLNFATMLDLCTSVNSGSEVLVSYAWTIKAIVIGGFALGLAIGAIVGIIAF